jgi:hypothetical protein
VAIGGAPPLLKVLGTLGWRLKIAKAPKELYPQPIDRQNL